MILAWSYQELSNCPDVGIYGQQIHVFLWQALFPAILTATACRLCLRIFYLFTDE